MADAVLQCSNLVKQFGDLTAVNDVSFTVAPGETYGLLGPNGAGKTTTISMVAGLLRATSGQVHVLGSEITPAANRAKGAIGLVPDPDEETRSMSLDRFFDPRSVAVVGASREKGKVGHDIVAALVAGGYDGE